MEILYDNIARRFGPLFNTIPMKEIDSVGAPYDFGSIMHIRLTDYSRNGNPTLIPKVNYTGEIGQRRQLSYHDVVQTNLLYNCNS